MPLWHTSEALLHGYHTSLPHFMHQCCQDINHSVFLRSQRATRHRAGSGHRFPEWLWDKLTTLGAWEIFKKCITCFISKRLFLYLFKNTVSLSSIYKMKSKPLFILPPPPTRPVDFVTVRINSSSAFHASQVFLRIFLRNDSGKQSSLELSWNLDHYSILNWFQNYTWLEKTQTSILTDLENWTLDKQISPSF